MPKAPKKEPAADGLEILRRRYYAGKPARVAEYEKVSADMDVARKIFRLREKAGLTQRQLAQRIGTTQSVIARLEDADYEGHSLAMLKRVAAALDQRLEIRFVPAGTR